MSYIGQQPLNNYVTKQSQTFTPDGSTVSFTLNFAVTSGIDIMLVINNVVQEPGAGKAYTASGTTLTMSEAPSASDSMYCIFLGLALQTVNPGDGSVGTAKLVDSAVTTAKLNSSLDLSSKTITLASNMKNTPAFLAHATSGQTLTDSTATTVICETEIYDTDSAYDTTTGKFTCPAGQSGKYVFTLFTFIEHNGSNDYRQIYSEFQKNDASIAYGSSHQLYDENFSSPMRGRSLSYTLAINLTAGDTVKGRVYQDNSADASRGLEQASFSGFKLIGV